MQPGVVIVGLGQIGMGYDLRLDPATHVYSHARAFSMHPEFALIGAVEPDAQRRSAFTATYGAPAYETLEAALQEQRPELVVLAVPTELHAATLRRVLELSSPQAVLCEKPLSYELGAARAMVQECADRGVALYVNYMRRSDAGVVECKRRLDSGAIAPPIKGVAWYSKGFLHNGSHFFNLLEHWLGPMQDFAVLSAGRRWQGVDPEPDARVRFRGGEVVFLAAWEECFSHYTVELLSATGRLRYERGGRLISWEAAQADRTLSGYTTLAATAEPIESGMNRYQWHVAEQLAAAMQGRDAHLCTGAEALRTLTAMTTIIERI